MTSAWPGERDPIREIGYELIVGFNDSGQPIYARGATRDPATLLAVQDALEAIEPEPASITSVTMGHVELHLQSGAQVVLRPVFRPSSGRYGDLLKVDERDLPMPDLLADLLNRWRRELIGD
jgi:hypothetical protein